MLIHDPTVYKHDRPKVLCSTIGSPCSPACKEFDPKVYCEKATLDLRYQTFVQAYWSYRANDLKNNEKWNMFYNCFHPKKAKTSKPFELKFPYDIHVLNNMEALATYEASKDLERDHISYRDRTRLNAINTGTDLEKRMASTDWDWKWYSRIRREGLEIKLSVAKDKNDFDRLMFKEFGDNYTDDGTYNISKTNPNFIRLKSLYDRLNKYLLVNINWEIESRE